MKTVRLITCDSSFQARLILGALDNEGIAGILHNENYYCPIKILQSHKIRADFICEVSPFSLDSSRQTIKSNYGQKYTF